ncbi:unnamed protein product [marine sediment metagenome]|uniref:Uncharacterized protein n=1 Tax=marine sediment metagenome TaxID=412755 RepID=X0UDF5_9ZZZZ
MKQFNSTNVTANGKLATVGTHTIEEIDGFIGSGAVCKAIYNGTKIGCPRTKDHKGPHMLVSLHRVIKIWED